jgi:DNA-binding NtrC family response regulator
MLVPTKLAEHKYKDAKREFDKHYLTALLAATSGNKTEASQRAGVHRTTLYDMLRECGLAGSENESL